MADIFVSYARQDRAKAQPFVALLEAQGWSVWWDKEIGPGSAFSKIIEREIGAARCVVVLWTKNSVESDWVNAEASEGLERRVLIPVKFEDVSVPLVFRQTHTADFQGWPNRNDEAEVEALLLAIAAAIGKPAENRSVVSKSKTRSKLVPSVAIGIALLICAIVYLSVQYKLPSDGSFFQPEASLMPEPVKPIAVYSFTGMHVDLASEVASSLNSIVGFTATTYEIEDRPSDAYLLRGVQVDNKLMVSFYDGDVSQTRFELEIPLDLKTLDEAVQDIVHRVTLDFDQPVSRKRDAIDNQTYLKYLAVRASLRSLAGEQELRAGVTQLQELIDLVPRWAEATAHLCSANIALYNTTNETADFEQAERHCFRATRLARDNPVVIISLGNLYRTAGQLDEAIASLTAALQLAPRNTTALRSLAKTYNQKDELSRAVELLKEAQRIEPQHWANFEALASIYFRRGMYEAAIDQYQNVRILQPDNPYALNDLGASHFMLEDFESAIPVWEESLVIEPSYQALSNLGTAYYMERDFDRALQTYLKAIAMNDNDYRMWLNAGEAAYHSASDEGFYYQKSLALASAQLKINPDAPEVLSALSLLYASLEQPERAEEFIVRAQAEGGDDIYVIYDIAVAYARLEQNQLLSTTLALMVEHGYSQTLIDKDANFD